ncbi:chemotaxis protein CheA [Neptuniibacter sp. CAU 1671]|uniref:chemotaxis protein CheA n=1 Tax=Neptuniibacter sp. CAU 1671 TaxID=3032593 RepID=UPI0023DABE36|nr:chemotaxis protein CheA [Neptuniibacter sp. CAU 1671]MDF2182575.1 chemotaxis protein CheA [Neptuniibacter sp. CAU 1671]
MSIDLSQFVATFLEESYEGLEVMESSLLNLEAADDETINTIFRAAHSIKGGAGTFGFNDVAHFTHVVETLLDEIRNGKQAVTPVLVNLLLESVDCIRALLEAAQDGPDAEMDKIEDVRARLKDSLAGESAAAAAPAASESAATVAQAKRWQIEFIPNADMLQAGHEPIFMFEALAQLGELEVTVRTDSLPQLADFDPQLLSLSWLLTLTSECPEDEVREIFEWVEDDCQLTIKAVESGPAAAMQGWSILFVPKPGLLQTGNEPLLMFAALADLGDLTVQADTKGLPVLAELDPEQVHLSWQLTLISDCAQSEVEEVFEWVEDECKLEIKPLVPVSAEAETPQSNTAPPVAEVKAEAPKPAGAPARKPKAAAEASSVRVDTDKIDALINRVGELVITQAMLGQIGSELADQLGTQGSAMEALQAGLEQLERNTRDLQEDIMRVRMLPISFVFNRFPRLVHDVSGKLGKKVELVLSGEQTEIDKTVMEKIGDPMVHLIRNSLDHGLETPDERRAAGKPETGRVELNAYHQGGYIIIDIIDDGRGLNTQKIYQKAVEKGLINPDVAMSDQEINDLIFRPGFSTADAVSDLSGRGVGMDVVRRNIESLGGHVSLNSEPGMGSTFSVKLPLTLAILDGQLIGVGPETYIIPVVSIVETMQAKSSALSSMGGESKLLHFRDEYIPLINLRKLFGLDNAPVTHTNLVAIVENGGQKVGIMVDELFGQQQVVIKSLEVNFKRIEGFSGATILGDGSVALILDIAGLVKRGLDRETSEAAAKRSNIFRQNTNLGGVA